MEWKDIIALSLGAVGTTLGIANYFRSVFDGRVRLKVIPSLAWRLEGGYLTASKAVDVSEFIKKYGLPALAIEVINLSKFPVTVADVGLCEGTIDKPRAPLLPPILAPGETWPKKLDSRQSVTAYSRGDVLVGWTFTAHTRAYATTSCDTTCLATSHALDAWRGAQIGVRAAISK